jgi:hypothetical protein
LTQLDVKASEIRDVGSNDRGALLRLQIKLSEGGGDEPALAALIQQLRPLPVDVAASVEDNEEFEAIAN